VPSDEQRRKAKTANLDYLVARVSFGILPQQRNFVELFN
jgi:hypothetical protein